ncbi:sulfatase-like hydrolase/transferase [Chitinophaga sp. MM2321]|uniref:sulfatase-like hydrolase/transferase n=1 Tax=Chitinophaga sp. MM2321 TaxID=3137178 RepID=UPI0032D5765D
MLVFLMIFGVGQTVAQHKSKPNIILCMADDQGWGDMGYNGHPVLKTPNFDSMARSGLRFDHFYAAAPVCSPTRGSVLTGRHPNRFGVFSWGGLLRPQEITVAEALKTAGYVTGHFGKWHLGPVRSGSPINPGNSGFDSWFSSPNFYNNNPILSREGIAVQTQGEGSMVTADAAIEFIRAQTGNNQPFLAVVWFGSPHNPYAAIEQDLQLYAGQEEKLRNYYGEITAMDRAFGKLRQELKTLKIDKNTILLFCSDNGGVKGFSATGGRGNKGQIYEGGLRVPAMLEWPDQIPKPRVTNIPFNTSDIYPTLLEITGVKMKDQPPLDGISFVPLLKGTMKSRTQPMGFWQYPGGGINEGSSAVLMAALLKEQQAGITTIDSAGLHLDAGVITRKYAESSLPGHAAWLDWPYKLHRINSKNEVKFELYNLEVDPEEKDDLSARHSKITKSMKSLMETWQKSVIFSLNGGDYR